MTPEEHNSWLARAHLAYATVNLLLIAVGIAWVLNAGFWDRTDQIHTKFESQFTPNWR